MSLRNNELARRQDGRVELRAQPLRVRWMLDGLVTSDGHELRADFTCSARALPEPSERRMLEEVLLGSRYSLNDDDLARHFEPALTAAAGKAAEKHSAADWTAGDLKGEMVEVIRSAAQSVAFACGVELLAPFDLELQSPSFQQERLRKMQHSLVEQSAAERMQHVQRATELLKQFHSLRQAAPELAPGQVLQQISPADRGQVLQMLLLAAAKENGLERLWAVAGPYLVDVNVHEGSADPQLHPLPPDLGPLRSVQPASIDGRPKLLIGARSGFMIVDPANLSDVQPYADQIDSQLGFNRVLYWGAGRGYIASHGQAGIVRWDPSQRDQAAAALRPDRFGSAELMQSGGSASAQTAGPRNLQVLDDSALVFSAGNRLLLTDLQKVETIQTASVAPVSAIVPSNGQLVVVHEDGTICSLKRGTRKLTCLTRRGARVCSAGSLPWLGSSRLLLAGENGAVDCMGLDDPLLTQYQSPHRGLRSISGCGEFVAGISSDRQRLIVWPAWEGRQPIAEIYLTGLTRHRIADIDFG